MQCKLKNKSKLKYSFWSVLKFRFDKNVAMKSLNKGLKLTFPNMWTVTKLFIRSQTPNMQ